MAELTVLCDPTDWKSTKLPFVSALDAALRCEICKDFYTAPVITNCCHTFCSLCIRRALHADGICPICRTAEQEYRLRKNTTVQDLLDAFEACRAQLYEFATREPEAGALPEGGMPVGAAEPSSHSPRRSQRRAVALRTRPNLRADGNDDGDGEYAPGAPSPSPSPSPSPPPPGLVDCPICRRRIKEASINSHVDKCLLAQSSPPPPATAAALPAPPAARRLRSNPTRGPSELPMERLPKLNYSLLNERQLRQKVRQLGIPDGGDKRLLQERHTEWLNLWNAAGDSSSPGPSKRELLKALDAWERAHLQPVNNKTKAAEWSDAAWATGHQDAFSDLIEQAKRTIKRPKIDGREEVSDDSNKPVKDEGGGEVMPKSMPEVGTADVVGWAASQTDPDHWFLNQPHSNPMPAGRPENALQPLQSTAPQQPSLPHFSALFSGFTPENNLSTAPPLPLTTPAHLSPPSIELRKNEKRKYSSFE